MDKIISIRRDIVGCLGDDIAIYVFRSELSAKILIIL